MAYTRETVQQIRDRILEDIKTEFTGELEATRQVPVYLKYMVMKVIATAVAFVAHALYGRVEYVSRQLNSTTADEKHLKEDGQERGVAYKYATYAKLSITVTGNGTITLEDYLLYGDIKFKPDAETVVVASANINFTAQASGTGGNALTGEVLTWEQPISGIDPTATVQSVLNNATDDENIEDYRRRILEDKRVTSSGGNIEDFKNWALEVAGNAKAWCYPHRLEPGGISIGISTSDGAPSQQQLDDTRNYIMTKMPANIHPDLFEVIAQPIQIINFTIANLSPDIQAVRDAVEAELADYILQNANPGATLTLSQIGEAISLAEGEISHTLIEPTADITLPSDTLPEFGVITWQ